MLWLFLELPYPLFNEVHSTAILDRQGELINASIADDGQWRFPKRDVLPDKYRRALLRFEDKHFYLHKGIDPFAVARAAVQNIKAKRIVSGGSTISMQLIRMALKSKERTVQQKIYECILAVRLELTYSKDEILALYAANAPFGGNVVGLDAASWRYFNRDASSLSWAESALLAVLPNAPSSMHPGKNRDQLVAKRNRLLARLSDEGLIDQLEYQLSISEPLPEAPYPLPQLAPHFHDLMKKRGYSGKRVQSTIDGRLQLQLNDIINKHYVALAQNQINNAAAMIIDVRNNQVLAYAGNTDCGSAHASYVDIVQAARSTGSILKPFLYAAMQQSGHLLPNTLVMDIPTQIAGYVPKNFDKSHDGVVPASEALARSLNIPAVRMLQDYGYVRFHQKLKKLGLTTIDKHPDHYGLSLILGGAEASLWDIAVVYTRMANFLNRYHENYGKYYEFSEPVTTADNPNHLPSAREVIPTLDAGATWLTFEALTSVNRPEQEAGWQYYQGSRKLAWKTGTSFGFRDAWAVGITPDYVVAIWVGNADGEGRPGLVGVKTAAPVLFDVFDKLPETGWFEPPYDELRSATVCVKSGYKASAHCSEVDTIWIHESGEKTSTCPYHKIVHLDVNEQYQVTDRCYPVDRIKHASWFVLPAAASWYYSRCNPSYRPIPEFASNCSDATGQDAIEIIYPQHNSDIFIPIELNGREGKTVFKAAHMNPDVRLFWHIGDEYLGSTRIEHTMAVTLDEGRHLLRLVDESGIEVFRYFNVVPDVRSVSL